MQMLYIFIGLDLKSDSKSSRLNSQKYTGPNCIEQFVKLLETLSYKPNFHKKISMEPTTKNEINLFHDSTKCYFFIYITKVKDDCDLTRKYRGKSPNSCNISINFQAMMII